jgi:preprotein translocase subunit YajC
MLSVLLAPTAPEPGNPMFSLFMLGGIIIVFWFFMIRPQAKKAKEEKKFVDNLQKGDKVVTGAGIHGTVNKINEDNTLQLEVSPGVYLKIERQAVNLGMSMVVNKK